MNLQNTYATLPDLFFQKINPVPVRHPEFVVFNFTLANELQIETKLFANSAGYFSGNDLIPGAQPLAQAYAGHQFGHFNMLGDGRAVLLGEHVDQHGRRWDLQLKGSGKTAYSRGGDGRAALGPMLREYMISEAMHALGVPTTRALAVVTTGETVERETTLPGAILARIAASHIRVGTFEYAATKGGPSAVKALADYSIHRHDPEALQTNNPYVTFYANVIKRQADLIAKWMNLGFIHGVMNTDNMSISGESIDYGPCAFMDEYNQATVFSSIDRHGRYAYGNQPAIAEWNLARLGEALLPLFDLNTDNAIKIAEEQLVKFVDHFRQSYLTELKTKLGLRKKIESDHILIEQLIASLETHHADYTNTFQVLMNEELMGPLQMTNFFMTDSMREFKKNWQNRLALEEGGHEQTLNLMRKTNPVTIPRNHLIEDAIIAATDNGNYQGMKDLVAKLQNPFDQNVDFKFRLPGGPGRGGYKTFCGT